MAPQNVRRTGPAARAPAPTPSSPAASSPTPSSPAASSPTPSSPTPSSPTPSSPTPPGSSVGADELAPLDSPTAPAGYDRGEHKGKRAAEALFALRVRANAISTAEELLEGVVDAVFSSLGIGRQDGAEILASLAEDFRESAPFTDKAESQ